MKLIEHTSLGERTEHELIVKKSRFICVLCPVQTYEQAVEDLTAIKKQHYNATHNCSAMVIGDDSAFERASDDGEPQGTAGIPMLDVLKKNNVTNLLAVVTRYFGGTLLGAGGLVRAYSGSVADALKHAPLVQNIPADEYCFTIDYADYGKLCQVASEFGAAPEGDFLETVHAKIVLPKEVGSAFQKRVTQAFMGADVFEITGECYITHPFG